MISDFDLVAGISRRDPEAFRALMECHAASVINLAYRFLGTIADAEDIAQEVFIRLYQHPPQLDPSAKLFTWLYRVTVNRCIDFLRRYPLKEKPISLETPLSGEESGGATVAERVPDRSMRTPRDQVAQAELITRTRSAVACLPAPLRVPLVLSTLENLSHEAIGQILGVSPKAVERRLARARELLKTRLQPYL